MPSRLRTALRRPTTLAVVTPLALVGLIGSGALVARATVGSAPTEPVASADASPAPDAEGAPATGTVTTSGGDDNVAVAANTKDGSTVYAVRLKVVMRDADVVDSGNAAVAIASCSDCTTVAIALEGVLVTGDAEVVAPENIALAINSGCTNCQTLAYAYQNLQTTDGKVRLTGAGRKTIAELRQRLHALRTSGLPVTEVRDEVNAVAGEFARVLETEVVPLGKPTDRGASPSPSLTPAASAEPATPTSTTGS